MTENELIAELVAHICEIELRAFFSYLGIKEHMQQHIAQFFADLFVVTAHQGVAKFIHFFDRIGTETLIRLLFVPRTLFSQLFKYVQHSIERLEFFLSTVHFGLVFRAKAPQCGVCVIQLVLYL